MKRGSNSGGAGAGLKNPATISWLKPSGVLELRHARRGRGLQTEWTPQTRYEDVGPAAAALPPHVLDAHHVALCVRRRG